MSDTTLRVLFALILIAVSSVVIFFGEIPSKIFLLLIGVVVVDELVHNFIGKKRFSAWHLASEIVFILGFVLVAQSYDFLVGFVWAAFVLNLSLLVYLFCSSMDSQRVKGIMTAFPAFVSLYMILSLAPIAWMMSQNNYVTLLVVYFMINFGMDTGGWFVGKNWGRNKLWERVSPKKTIEGLIGGITLAAVLGSIATVCLIGDFYWFYIPLFCLLGALSQVGDLVQSKIKRQFALKDSSNLIPGHGGAFDRIDSLIFMAPFYVLVVNYF